MQKLASDQNPAAAIALAGERAVLSKRYASAFYNLAVEQSALDVTVAQVAALDQILHQVPEFRRIIADPRLSQEQLQNACNSVAVGAKLSPLMKNFLALVAHNRRTALLPDIVSAFAAEHARRSGIVNVSVRAAQPLSEAQRQQLGQHLSQATNSKVQLQVSEDPSLIGGMVINFGSTQIDASLQGRLAALAQQLREAA